VLFRTATAEIEADPMRYARLCLRRFRYFWLFDETNPKTRVAIYRVSHLCLTGLALAGLLAASPAARRRLAPTIASAAALSVFHALTIVSARFHVPIEPLMAVWAGAGVSGLHVPRWLRAFQSTATADHVERIGVVSRLG
jgi:hypothetical protein